MMNKNYEEEVLVTDLLKCVYTLPIRREGILLITHKADLGQHGPLPLGLSSLIDFRRVQKVDSK